MWRHGGLISFGWGYLGGSIDDKGGSAPSVRALLASSYSRDPMSNDSSSNSPVWASVRDGFL